MNGPQHPTFVLINSISRSGGTYFKALFDGIEDFLVFPIEFPLKKAQGIDFLTRAEYEEIRSTDQLLDQMDLDYHLSEFSSHPYVRSFGRTRKTQETRIDFDCRGFRRHLDESYSTLASVGDAYRFIWSSFFRWISVVGHPFNADRDQPTYVNHFATDILGGYGPLEENAQEICKLVLVHIVREPLENIASLKRHWRWVSSDRYFVRLALARWEMSLYSALRNKALHTESCEVIFYDADPGRLSEQLKGSRQSSLVTLAHHELKPTVLGIPLTGQSYRERRGQTVAGSYNYESAFSSEELSYLKSNVERIYSGLGIQRLPDLSPGTASLELPFLQLDDDTFDVFIRAFGNSVSFAASYNVNIDSNVVANLRQQRLFSPRGLVKQLKLVAKALRPRA